MKPRVVFLPLDERFCTRDYFIALARAAGVDVATPPRAFLGAKKTPPDADRLRRWLAEVAGPGDAVLLSVDMLAHGGLIPSRMSLDAPGTVLGRLGLLEDLKRRGCRLYGTVCVTRTPAYDSAEEEPDYWQVFGRRIWEFSRIAAAFRSGDAGRARYRAAAAALPRWIAADYLARRRRNYRLVRRCVELAAAGTFDFLNVVMDDNTEGSLSLWEAGRHAAAAARAGLGKDMIAVHSGADEATLTLLSRFLLDRAGARPLFRIGYTVPETRGLVPPYEGLPLERGAALHAEAAGGEVAAEGDGRAADIGLLVHNPTARAESSQQRRSARNRRKAAEAVRALGAAAGVTGVAGVKYANGSDNDFVDALLAGGLDWRRVCYAGWNTAGNTLGTVCAFAVVRWLAASGRIEADEEALAELQAVFLVEHWGFQSNVRKSLLTAARLKGHKPWSLVPVEAWAEDFTARALLPYAARSRAALGLPPARFSVYFPWHRSFELGVEFEPRGPAAGKGV